MPSQHGQGAPSCFACRRPLTGEGHGLDASMGRWVHVRRHHAFADRHGIRAGDLEKLRWSVGERVSYSDGQALRRGVIVAVGGGAAQVELGRDETATVEFGRLRPG